MKETTYEQYMEELTKFSQKHNNKSELTIFTSPMVDNKYHKDYSWTDGANFYEENELITEMVDVTIHGITIKVAVEFWRTEYWSSEDSSSKYYYSKA